MIIEKINETNTWFLENIDKVDKPIARMTNKKTFMTNEKEGKTKYPTNVKNNRKYYKKLCL